MYKCVTQSDCLHPETTVVPTPLTGERHTIWIYIQSIHTIPTHTPSWDTSSILLPSNIFPPLPFLLFHPLSISLLHFPLFLPLSIPPLPFPPTSSLPLTSLSVPECQHHPHSLRVPPIHPRPHRSSSKPCSQRWRAPASCPSFARPSCLI